jgi:hypothetical protein
MIILISKARIVGFARANFDAITTQSQTEAAYRLNIYRLLGRLSHFLIFSNGWESLVESSRKMKESKYKVVAIVNPSPAWIDAITTDCQVSSRPVIQRRCA